MNESGSAVIGTPEMAIAQIQRLVDQSGGFGCFLCSAATSPTATATLRSYELFAQYVMPHFQGQLVAAPGVLRLDHRRRPRFVKATIDAIDKSIGEYAAERGRPAPPKLAGD